MSTFDKMTQLGHVEFTEKSTRSYFYLVFFDFDLCKCLFPDPHVFLVNQHFCLQ